MSATRVPIGRVARIASRGECWSECVHRDCDAARLAREVLELRLLAVSIRETRSDTEAIRMDAERKLLDWVTA